MGGTDRQTDRAHGCSATHTLSQRASRNAALSLTRGSGEIKLHCFVSGSALAAPLRLRNKGGFMQDKRGLFYLMRTS